MNEAGPSVLSPGVGLLMAAAGLTAVLTTAVSVVLIRTSLPACFGDVRRVDGDRLVVACQRFWQQPRDTAFTLDGRTHYFRYGLGRRMNQASKADALRPGTFVRAGYRCSDDCTPMQPLASVVAGNPDGAVQ